MNKHKFIRVQKGEELKYYRCNDYNMSSIDCFRFMRSDLNRVLYDSLPSGSILIDCGNETTTSTTSTTTTIPCDIGFNSVIFINNESFPYDYNEQKGYILIDLIPSSFYRLYQIRILSGTTVIRDWTTPISSNNFSFKLPCANYKIQVRDYNEQSCISEINNINIPCLTTTTSGGSTTSTTSTTTSTSTTLTTSSTTTPTFNPCGVYGIRDQNIVQYNPLNDTNSTIYNGWSIPLGISFYDNKLHSVIESGSAYIVQIYNLSNGDYTTKNITQDPTGQSNLIARGQAQDNNGNLFVGEANIAKYTPNSTEYVFDSVISRTSYSFPNSTNFAQVPISGLVYISSINCFLTQISDNHSGQTIDQLWLIKADGSNLILRKYGLTSLGNYSYIRSIYVHNSKVYLQATSPSRRLFSIDLTNGNIIDEGTTNMIFASGTTQNSSCINVNFNDNFYVSIPNMVCTETTLNWTFNAFNGSGNYQYSTDYFTYTNITGNYFDITLNKTYSNYTQQVYQVYIKDLGTQRVYQIMLDNRNNCIPNQTTTTTSTSTTSTTTSTSTTTIPQCIPLSNVAITGNFVVYSDIAYEYGLNGAYDGSPITSYLWEVVGGVINNSNTDPVVNVTWDNSEFPTPYIYLTVTNCNGSVQVSRKITIQNLV